MLAHGLRESGRPWGALHGNGRRGRQVEVSGWLDEGLVVRAASTPSVIASNRTVSRNILKIDSSPYQAA